MIRVACVGITVMDRIYYVEGLPTESGKYVARNYTEVGGGPAATTAVAAARLGRRSILLVASVMTTRATACWQSWNPGALTPVTPNGITRRNLRNPPSWWMPKASG